MPQLFEVVGSTRTGFGPPGRVNAGMIRSTSNIVTIELVGWRVAAEHMYTVAAMTVDAIQQILGTLQIDMTHIAKLLAEPHRDTGATIGSISAVDKSGVGTGAPTLIQFDGNDMWADVGAGGDVIDGAGEGAGQTADPQAALQEFGFIHTGSGEFIVNPFMVPALDSVTTPFINAMIQVGQFGDRFPSGLPESVMSKISRYRSGLYTASKAMGDVQVFGVGFQGIRGPVLQAARRLGDMNAVMRGGLASIARLETRAIGSIATGFGRPSLSPGANYSSASNRIYNRFAGRGMGLSIRGLSTMR